MKNSIKTIAYCKRQEKDYLIVRKEEANEICFRNDLYKIICNVVAIDKCVFNKVKGEKKCDFLFLFDKNEQEYKRVIKTKFSPAFYVELKGAADLEKACEQLFNAIDKTIEQIKNFEPFAYVVSSKKPVPNLKANEFYIKTKRLIRKEIEFEVSPHTITI